MLCADGKSSLPELSLSEFEQYGNIILTMKTNIIRSTLLASFVGLALASPAQTIGVKTNLLYDATLSPNLGVEMSVAPHWSVELSGNFNDWAIRGHQWKHWFVQPEARYWLCENFGGHFFAAHAVAGEFNVGNLPHGFEFLGTNFAALTNRRYQGWGAGLGIGYGYTWMLGRHWNLEAEIGLGWVYTRYDSYPCAKCGSRIDNNRVHNYVGPTKAAINLVYVF